MKKILPVGCVLVLMVCFSMCRKAKETAVDDDSNFDPRLSGGISTAFDISSHAFSNMLPGLGEWDAHVHEYGDKIFEQPFVASPAPIYGGLGPAFNNVSCVSCHHNDGMGVPTSGLPNSSLLIRISIPGADEHGGDIAAPGFGLQIQDNAILGAKHEAKVNISYEEQPFSFADGETASLRKPTYSLTDPYTDLPGSYMLSPRMARPVFGLGLLANVPEATILSFADPMDANGDGISGKANYVYDGYQQKTVLGRFGLKANTSTILMQVATAFQQDMGLTSYVHTDKSVSGQAQMSSVPTNDGVNLADSTLNAVAFYIQSLAVPARRDVTEPQVKQGEAIFTQIQCSSCHIPTMYTDVDVKLPQISHQRIHPYTDMLLHDMGDGLADGRPDFLADGNEWRTSPLWGVGLFERTNGTTYYLHDGRARTLVEAILWHGGEAEQAKQKFTQLSKSDRDAVVAFLRSL